MNHTKTVTERRRKEPGSGGSTYKGKFRQIQSDRPGGSALPDHNIDGEILHGRIKHLFHLSVQAMDLVYKKNIPFLKIIQNRRHFSRLLNCRAGSHFHMHTHFIGNNTGKGSFSKSRRAIEKDMVQGIVTLFGSFNIYF